MWAILKKELWSSFGNWTALLIISAFSVIGTLFLFFFDNDSNIFEIGTASLQSYFVLVPWLMMFIVPAISMKALAEEQQTGTLSWLFSQPLTLGEIIGGKFLSVWVITLLCLAPSLFYLYTISTLGVPQGNFDLGATLGSYFGLLLLTAAFSAVGILASSLSSNQIMAYLVGVLLSFFFYFGIEQIASYKLLGSFDYLLSYVGFYQHFLAFSRGLIDSRDIFYFLLITCICLFGAKLILNRKR